MFVCISSVEHLFIIHRDIHHSFDILDDHRAIKILLLSEEEKIVINQTKQDVLYYSVSLSSNVNKSANNDFFKVSMYSKALKWCWLNFVPICNIDQE